MPRDNYDLLSYGGYVTGTVPADGWIQLIAAGGCFIYQTSTGNPLHTGCDTTDNTFLQRIYLPIRKEQTWGSYTAEGTRVDVFKFHRTLGS